MWRVWLSTFENHRFGLVQLLPTDWWAHMLVPKMGGPDWIHRSILFSVAEPVFHSSVETHVCYTPPPGSAASCPCAPCRTRGWLYRSTKGGCGSSYSRVHRLYHSGFLTPFKGRTCVGDWQALYEQSSTEPSPKTWEVFLVLGVSWGTTLPFDITCNVLLHN